VVGFTFVAIVSVEVADPATAGVMLVDEKTQVVSLGRAPHARLVAELKPFTEVTVTVMTASLPALNEPSAGLSVRVKAAGPGHTVTATPEDVDDALLASPP
jgi:hypothetical protein